MWGLHVCAMMLTFPAPLRPRIRLLPWAILRENANLLEDRLEEATERELDLVRRLQSAQAAASGREERARALLGAAEAAAKEAEDRLHVRAPSPARPAPRLRAFGLLCSQ